MGHDPIKVRLLSAQLEAEDDQAWALVEAQLMAHKGDQRWTCNALGVPERTWYHWRSRDDARARKLAKLVGAAQATAATSARDPAR